MRLGRADLEAIRDFLVLVDDLHTDEAYPVELLEALRGLVPCDSARYQEVEPEVGPVTDGPACEAHEASPAIDSDPIADYRARTGDLTTVRRSDVLGRGRQPGSPGHPAGRRPVDRGHVLDIGLSVASRRLRSIVLARGGDAADFSERDRVILELLRPHLRAREALTELQRRTGEPDQAGDTGADPGPQVLLTSREREILRLVGQGKTNAQIAADLWITPATVKKHLENVYGKLGVVDRAAAAMVVRSLSGLSA